MFGALVVLGLAMAFITSWVLDSYDTARHPKRSVQVQQLAAGDGDDTDGSSPPFPGGELRNIFWFVQVSFTHSCFFLTGLPKKQNDKVSFEPLFSFSELDILEQNIYFILILS